MFHGLTHQTIYAAARATAVFVAPDGASFERPGTAFGVDHDGKLVIVTNRHMVDATFGSADSKYAGYQLLHLLCDIRIQDAPDGTPGAVRRLIVPASHNEFLFDENPRNDVAVIYNVQSANADGSEDRQWSYCFRFGDLATEDELRSELYPFDFLAFPGFPTGFDRLGLRAIVRGGTVASDPRFPYSFEQQDRGDIILYEGFSFGGSSGSPVIALPKVPPINVDPHPENRFRRLLVVGVNAGHIEGKYGHHTGLSYFVRSSVVRRVVERHI